MDISKTVACRGILSGLMFFWNLGHGKGILIVAFIV